MLQVRCQPKRVLRTTRQRLAIPPTLAALARSHCESDQRLILRPSRCAACCSFRAAGVIAPHSESHVRKAPFVTSAAGRSRISIRTNIKKETSALRLAGYLENRRSHRVTRRFYLGRAVRRKCVDAHAALISLVFFAAAHRVRCQRRSIRRQRPRRQRWNIQRW